MGFNFEKLSVLVVEDTDPMRKLIVSVLQTLGIVKIYTAKDGDDGFKVFCHENPDVVITDWHMEPVSGIDLVQQIRKNPQSPNKTAPVIMMTGFSALQRVANARDMGTTEFLVKPFSASALAKRIAYVINRPRDFVKTKDYFGPDRRRRDSTEYEGVPRRASDRLKNNSLFKNNKTG